MNKFTRNVASATLATSLLLSAVSGASAATYTVKSGDTLSKIAKNYGTTYQQIMKQNGLSSTFLRVGQTLQIGSTTSTSTTVASTNTYVVKSGDTLSGIAKKYGTTYQQIMKQNGLSSTFIRVGQTLKIGGTASTSVSASTTAAATKTYVVKSGDTLSGIAKKYGTTYQQIMKQNGLSSTFLKVGQTLKIGGTASATTATSTTASTASAVTTYVVKTGDSLSRIAKIYGTTYKAIMDLNGLKTTTIHVGQKLKVSGKTVASAKTSTTSSTVSSANVVSVAKKYIGIPYVYGGASPSGFDCSGFIYYVFKQSGKSVSRTSAAGYYGLAKKVSSPQVGDLVFFSNTYKSGISHVGIYIGSGQMISASGSKVTISSIKTSYWNSHLTGYGRI